MRWLSLLFLGFELVARARAAFAADYQEFATSHLTRLRHDLLTGAASLRNETYDPKVAPTGRSADYSAAGTDVSMQVRFFKVQAVKASEGSMRLKVWMRMLWKDTRLTWNPDDWVHRAHVKEMVWCLTLSS